MQSENDILVIGDGAVGKAAALALAQAGLAVTLLRPPSGARSVAADPASWDVRVYALNQVAHDLLSRLRVWSALDAQRIAPVEAMVVHGDAPNAGRLDLDAYGARTSALAWIVEDRNLNQALDSALRFSPSLRIVEGLAQHLEVDASAAHVTLDNGTKLDARLIVGADGANSWVRGQCDIGLDYRSYGQRAIVCNFECEQPHRGVAYQWFTSSEGIIALLPLAGQRVSLVWSAPESLASTLLNGSLGQLAQRLSALKGHALGRLQPLQPEAVKSFPLSLQRPHSIMAPRVALVGDAAHVVHPLAGHGMNLGFADVNELVQQVSRREAHRECGDERVLARYARARKEDIFLMLAATDGLERLFSIDVEPVRAIRNLGLNLVNNLPVLKRALISHALGRKT
ncbi:MAG TPA: FAD-dependent monooxygenase [Noviherbaspirillum sp.]